MPQRRPFFLNLLVIRLPVAGFMSILHRVTGVLLVLAIPGLLWLLQHSLASPAGFAETRAWLGCALGKIGLFLLLWALSHHLLAGLRYLLLDLDLGIHRPAYRYSAWLVLLAAPPLALLLTRGLL
jgi:succinate dehydrogenase / fumarate reductase, cytochrome b subunit